jgi:hypothetical protein
MRFKVILIAFSLFPLFLLLPGCASRTVSVGAASVPTTLHVVRTNNNPYAKQAAPFDRTVSNASTVQQLYRAAYALPSATGTYHCVKDIGLVYHLNFLQGTALIKQMDLQATGCSFLHISKTDVRLINSSFVSLFTRTIGIPSLVPWP